MMIKFLSFGQLEQLKSSLMHNKFDLISFSILDFSDINMSATYRSFTCKRTLKTLKTLGRLGKPL